MKDKQRGLFNLAQLDSVYFNNKQDKIVIENCQQMIKDCQIILSSFNKSYRISQKYIQNKDYIRSIEELKTTYTRINNLDSTFCNQCVKAFRSAIIQSLEEIQEDLKKMVSGFFRPKKYASSYQLVCTVLEEIRK